MFRGGDKNINRAGKKPGTSNRVTSEALRIIAEELRAHESKYRQELTELKGRAFVDVYTKLLTSIIPRTIDANLFQLDSVSEFINADRSTQLDIISKCIANETAAD